MIISLEWLNQTPRNGSIKLIALPILAIVEVKHPIYYKISLIFFKIPSFNNSFLFCQYPYSTFLFQINFIDVDPDPNISTFRPLDQMVVNSSCQIWFETFSFEIICSSHFLIEDTNLDKNIESKSEEQKLCHWFYKIFFRQNVKTKGNQWWCLHLHKYVSSDFRAKYGRYMWGSSFTEIYLMRLENWKWQYNIQYEVGNKTYKASTSKCTKKYNGMKMN